MKPITITIALLFSGIAVQAEVVLFRAFKSGQRVHINWSAKSIADEYTYVIQRSKDGVVFKDLNVLHTGTTSESVEFFDVDNHPPKGTVYYRIKLVSSNGVESFSDISVVRNGIKSSNKDFASKTETLVLVQSSDGTEFYGKIHFNEYKPVLKAKDLEEAIPDGNYIIIATSNDVFRNLMVSIF